MHHELMDSDVKNLLACVLYTEHTRQLRRALGNTAFSTVFRT